MVKMAVRSRNTRAELAVQAALRGLGILFETHPDLPSTPDVVVGWTAILVHGCFWHRHGCQWTKTPTTRVDFWQQKFARNVRRDREAQRRLKKWATECW